MLISSYISNMYDWEKPLNIVMKKFYAKIERIKDMMYFQSLIFMIIYMPFIFIVAIMSQILNSV